MGVRFAGYGGDVDETAHRYMQALFALPAMQAWRAAAAIEPESVPATEALRTPLPG